MAGIQVTKSDFISILKQMVFLKSMMKGPAELPASSTGYAFLGDDTDYCIDPFNDTNAVHSDSGTIISSL